MAARTPEDVDRLFGERLNAGDVDGVAALYEPHGILVMEEGSPRVGHAAIREAIATFVSMKPHIRMNVKKVVSGGGDIAVLYNDWELTLTGPDGKTIEDAGRACEVVRRQADGTWLFAIDDPRARG
jgi:uncharacterized protein (TIGR02246 family)